MNSFTVRGLCAVFAILAAIQPAIAGKNGGKQELVLVEREIASSPDPSYYPGSNHYIKNGAAEPLFKADPEGQIQPCLARGSKQIDEYTWEIYLRPEGKFWSGAAIDAEAVIGSLERSRETNTRALPFLKDLKFKALDRWTLQVTTTRTNQFVPLNLSYMELCIFNSKAAHNSVETMDMSGMYKVVAFEPKQRMILEINPNYYGKKPTIPRIIHEEISDPETRTLAIMSGRADMVFHISNESVAQLKNNKDVVLNITAAASTQTIYLNLQNPILKDIRVRQALAWGLNRQEISLLGTEGLGLPLTTWLSSNPRYRDHKSDVYTHFDPQKSGKLLDEAGWKMGKDGFRHKDGQDLSITLMTWGQDKTLGEAIQHQWTKLGVKARVQHGDYSLIQAARDTGEWDAFIEAWQSFGDEYSLLCGQFAPTGGANYGKYNDMRTNSLLEKLRVASSEKQRRELAVEINAHVAKQCPAIYVCSRIETTATRRNLKGYVKHFRQFENGINANLYFE